jgi:Tol biopolymer transport system component
MVGEAAATETATLPEFQSPIQTPIGPTAQELTPTETPAERTFQSPVQTSTPSPTPWPTPTPRPEPGLVGLVQDVAISPDGQQVLFISQQSRAGNRGVYALSLDDDQIRPFLQRGDDIRPSRVDWSPDGRMVAIATLADPWTEFGNFHDLYVTGADGRELSNLTADLDEVIEDWAWSTDSLSIACITEPKDRTSPLNLWICRVDIECVRFAVTAYSVSGNAKGYLAWSPDSTKLLVGYEPGVAFGILVLVDLATGSVDSMPQPATYGAPYPLWFPDGSRILFFAGQEERLSEPVLWSLTVKDKVLSKVTELHRPNPQPGDMALFPEWLNDGRIGFYWNDAIWSIRPDGSELERLSPEEVRLLLTKAPSFSIAGNRMALIVHESSGGIGGRQLISRLALLDLADKSLVIK